MLQFEKAKKRIISKKAPSNMIFINGEPVDNKVVLDGEGNYIIRIETDDETIEINVGSDSLNRKVIKAPGKPLRPATIRSADTYLRNRY
jgi:fructose-specific component phosphotransferase system IIB-like protein